MRKPALALLCTACLVMLSACSITGNQENDSSVSVGNSSKPVENNISAGKPVEKAAKAEPKNMEEQVQAWLAEGLIKPTGDPNVWQATKPLPRPEFTLKHEKPVYPEAGYVYNEAGAEAVAIYWGKLYEYAINSNDISDIEQVCSKEVEKCRYLIDATAENISIGAWDAEYEEVSPTVTAVGYPADDAFPGEYTVRVDFKTSSGYFFDTSTLKLRKSQKQKLKRWSNLSYANGKWVISYTEVVED